MLRLLNAVVIFGDRMSALMDCALNFKSGQIVSLECGNACLHSEVIQVVEARQICWVRPLMLVEIVSGKDVSQQWPQEYTLSDLRNGADLLWPLSLFRAALDTEVISLLSQLQSLDSDRQDSTIASRELRDFVDRVWEAFPTAFN